MKDFPSHKCFSQPAAIGWKKYNTILIVYSIDQIKRKIPGFIKTWIGGFYSLELLKTDGWNEIGYIVQVEDIK